MDRQRHPGHVVDAEEGDQQVDDCVKFAAGQHRDHHGEVQDDDEGHQDGSQDHQDRVHLGSMLASVSRSTDQQRLVFWKRRLPAPAIWRKRLPGAIARRELGPTAAQLWCPQ